MKSICVAVALQMGLSALNSAHSATLPGIPEFIDSMVARHQFKRAELENVFARAAHQPSVIEAISRPSTRKPWPEYRESFVNRERIRFGLAFWRKHKEVLERSERKYRVPQEIIVAVIGIETVYGRDLGKYRVLDALTTLAFDYPRRADFFRDELEHYLLLARDEQYDLLDMRGSYAGAMGIPQFMPSSHRRYAVDFNGNRNINLRHEAADAIGSVANYLQSHDWTENGLVAVRARADDAIESGSELVPRTLASWALSGVTPTVNPGAETVARLIVFTVGDGKEYWLAFANFNVITRYNNSDYYAMTVFQLAEELKTARKASAAR